MKGSNTKAMIAVAVVVIAVVVAAIGYMSMNKKDNTSSSSTSGTTGSSSSDSTTADASDAVSTDTVNIQNFAFSPAKITVKVGTKVTWTNKDSVSHTVTADDASSSAPASQLISQNKTFSFTFDKAGTYTYHCEPHPSMQGTVVVTE